MLLVDLKPGDNLKKRGDHTLIREYREPVASALDESRSG
jgi:hypothetical protein